jgi:hypothetical protein
MKQFNRLKMSTGIKNFILASLAILLAFGFTACNRNAQNSKKHDYKNAVITLERSVCYGRCPAYKLKIEGNGTVSYEGIRFVAVEGKQTGSISQEDFKKMVDQFFAIQYFDLQDKYDEDISDVPHCETSLSIDGKTKKIYNRAGGPESLSALEEMIDKTVNVKQWVEAPTE